MKLADDTLTNKQVAVKVFTLPKVGGSVRLQRIHQEVENLKALNHENIVKIIHIYEDPKQFLMVMEFAGKATLQDVLKVTKESKLSEIRKIESPKMLG